MGDKHLLFHFNWKTIILPLPPHLPPHTHLYRSLHVCPKLYIYCAWRDFKIIKFTTFRKWHETPMCLPQRSRSCMEIIYFLVLAVFSLPCMKEFQISWLTILPHLEKICYIKLQAVYLKDQGHSWKSSIFSCPRYNFVMHE